jgi:hypothetical protein
MLWFFIGFFVVAVVPSALQLRDAKRDADLIGSEAAEG